MSAFRVSHKYRDENEFYDKCYYCAYKQDLLLSAQLLIDCPLVCNGCKGGMFDSYASKDLVNVKQHF